MYLQTLLILFIKKKKFQKCWKQLSTWKNWILMFAKSGLIELTKIDSIPDKSDFIFND